MCELTCERVVMISCWSSKGGSGTTTVAVALAVLNGRQSDHGSLLLDLEGDSPTVFGVPEPTGPGLTDWLAASPSVSASAIDRLEHSVTADVRLVPRGRRELAGESRTALCLTKLSTEDRPVVIDVGRVTGRNEPDDRVRRRCIEASSTSLLVTRACFVSLRRALSLPFRPSGIVLVEEAGRALGKTDVEDVLGVPIVASVPIDASVARAVDAGLFASRLPSPMGRSLRDVA